nr:TMEM43 family protein [uncultured Carboxylicivirga sp.]
MENQDTFTEETTQSWGSRIMESIKSVLFGIILFLGAFIVLWWNEGRAVKTAKGLKEGQSQVVTIDPNVVDKANDGKLVHLTGKVLTDKILNDAEFDINVNALKLRRNIEMYQWVEETKKEKEKEIGGSEKTKTTYSYVKKWTSTLEKSASFKVPEGHMNPTSFPYSKYTITADKAKIGEYLLPESLLSDISNFKPYAVHKIDTAKFKNATILNEGSVELGSGVEISQKIFIGNGSSTSPEVGDVKVSFQIIEPGGDYSIISKQITNTFESFATQTGTSINVIKEGIHSSDAMFAAEHSKNTITTWILRVLGFLMMFGGLTMIFRPLVVIADVLPFLGNLLDVGLSLFSGLLSFTLSFVTIAIAWIVYRPILGVALLVVGGGAFIYLFMRAKAKKV